VEGSVTAGARKARKGGFPAGHLGHVRSRRDEFYYLESGHHLAWGTWTTPLVPVLYRLQEAAFSHSAPALAVVPALIGGAYVVLPAAVTADLGGRHRGGGAARQ